MSDDRGAGFTDISLAFLVGGVIGATLALLFAPAPGIETRRRIRETHDKLRSRLRDGGNEWRESVSENLGKAKEGMRSFVDDKKSRSQAAYAAAKEAWQKAAQEPEVKSE